MDRHARQEHSSNQEGAQVPNGQQAHPSSVRRASTHTSETSSSLKASHDVDRISNDSKPRLSRDAQDFLERQFQEHQKPSTSTKKSFAENLGVPVEKINNWFQNRRAKFKQDARKYQEGAYNQFYANPTTNISTTPADAAFVDPSFYTTTTFDQTVYPQQFVATAQRTAWQLADNLNNGGAHASTHAYPPRPPMHSQNNYAEMTFNDTPDAFYSFFGLDDNPQIQTNGLDQSALSNFSKQFNEPTATDPFPMGPIPRAEINSNGSASTSYVNQTSSEDFSSHYPQFPDHRDLGPRTSRHGPDLRNEHQVVHHPPHPVTAEHAQLPHWVNAYPSEAYDGRSMSYPNMGQVLQGGELPFRQHAHLNTHYPVPTPISYVSQPVLPSQNLHLQAPQPESSHAQSFNVPGYPQAASVHDTVGLIKQESREETPLTEPAVLSSPTTASSGLAARRQKRPAALGTAALRSASYNAGSSLSPKTASHNMSVSEHNLRRIKSTTGLIQGRIQKSNPGSAPRSPLSISFAEAAQSPKFARHLSETSLVALAGTTSRRSSNAGPMTPQSPTEQQRQPSTVDGSIIRNHASIPENDFESINSVWANMPMTADTTSNSVWSYMPQTSDTVPSYASPPTSPMDPTGMQHMHLTSGEAARLVSAATEAQSAPPWQQQFDIPSWNPYAGSDIPPVPDIPAQYLGRPATAGEKSESILAYHAHDPSQYAPRQEYSSHSPSSKSRPSTTPNMSTAQMFDFMIPGIPRENIQYQHVIPQAQPSLEELLHRTPQKPDTAAIAHMQQAMTPQKAKTPPTNGQVKHIQPPGELQIHEYSPREPADSSKLPPKNRGGSQPKNYSFQNTGPEQYSSP